MEAGSFARAPRPAALLVAAGQVVQVGLRHRQRRVGGVAASRPGPTRRPMAGTMARSTTGRLGRGLTAGRGGEAPQRGCRRGAGEHAQRERATARGHPRPAAGRAERREPQRSRRPGTRCSAGSSSSRCCRRARHSRGWRAATAPGSRLRRRGGWKPQGGTTAPSDGALVRLDRHPRPRSSPRPCRAGSPRWSARRSPGSARPRRASKATPSAVTPAREPTTSARRRMTPLPFARQAHARRRPAGSVVASIATSAGRPLRRSDSARVAWRHAPPASKPSEPVGPAPAAGVLGEDGAALAVDERQAPGRAVDLRPQRSGVDLRC